MTLAILAVAVARILPPAEAAPPPMPSVLNLRAVLEVDAAGRLAHVPRHYEAAKRATPESLVQGAPNATTLAEYTHLRFATVRLQATVHQRDLLEPWRKDQGKAVYVGSGFVVRNTKTGPLVVTNAHVVNDAQDLSIQVPAAGQQMYKARPLLVNHDMDIALVSLVSNEEYQFMMEKVGFELPVVKLLETPPKLGMEVVAMGYPLGVSTVKITKGVLSGHEQVSEYMAYQQSAPISPGNSGGPLFLDGTDTVLGINFAAAVAEGAQAQNYAIPSFRVLQMLHQLDLPDAEHRQYSQKRCKADRRHCSFTLPQLHAEAAPGDDQLYERYGCAGGILLTRLLPTSIFAHADPPISPKTFITSINGVTIDKFGAAPASEYFDDTVPFTEHMFMEPKLDKVSVGTCACGKEGTAEVPLQFSGSFQDDPTVKTYDEVNLDLRDADYERFAGVTVQPLSTNLIQTLVQERQRLDLVRYMVEPAEGALVVTGVDGLSEAAGVLQVGDVIKTLNGHPVATLEDFRAYFAPDATCAAATETGWVLEVRGGRELVAHYHAALHAARKVHAMPAVANALKSAGLPSLVQQHDQGLEVGLGRELGELVARPVEDRRDLRRGGKRWGPRLGRL